MEWISIKDRLPLKNTSVICALKIDGEKFSWELDYCCESFGQDGFWLNENGGEYESDYTEYVTHWMPLPDPPKE